MKQFFHPEGLSHIIHLVNCSPFKDTPDSHHLQEACLL